MTDLATTLAATARLIAAKREQRPDAHETYTRGIDDAMQRLVGAADATAPTAWALDVAVSK